MKSAVLYKSGIISFKPKKKKKFTLNSILLNCHAFKHVLELVLECSNLHKSYITSISFIPVDQKNDSTSQAVSMEQPEKTTAEKEDQDSSLSGFPARFV